LASIRAARPLWTGRSINSGDEDVRKATEALHAGVSERAEFREAPFTLFEVFGVTFVLPLLNCVEKDQALAPVIGDEIQAPIAWFALEDVEVGFVSVAFTSMWYSLDVRLSKVCIWWNPRSLQCTKLAAYMAQFLGREPFDFVLDRKTAWRV